ncbi:MAG: helix-turn-helix domain-containing protein [Eubacteriales bacterium]
MAIGKRIRHFRTLMGLTQKQLGEQLGFTGKSSDVRIAQYEYEARIPKHDLIKQMANLFGVSTHALDVPNIDSSIGLMHTLFTLEDMYGLKIREIDGDIHLWLDVSIAKHDPLFIPNMHSWLKITQKLENGEITKDEYDNWRYNYPTLREETGYASIPSNFLNDAFLEDIE